MVAAWTQCSTSTRLICPRISSKGSYWKSTTSSYPDRWRYRIFMVAVCFAVIRYSPRSRSPELLLSQSTIKHTFMSVDEYFRPNNFLCQRVEQLNGNQRAVLDKVMRSFYAKGSEGLLTVLIGRLFTLQRRRGTSKTYTLHNGCIAPWK